ncbi:site-2 protease family protein [Phascolarctobacterium sp.]|uniref:site-2 protease family protein n=1 Tax=Phascolarctobacterium sp. TaxID=2049039 RepID=UPI002A80943F|nr:site-2 protease family protein [Phascolarctobacterium sp.]MDY5044304.1 site-2 protease family protein [Phascolarctobacterium sp.]MEE1194452.1 site-2 protease family protein [Phascolarctobacterium sp.]
MLDFASMIYRIPALLFAISIHEYAHAQCADSMGDPTARYMGRLTFNPMAHLDPIGAILLVVAGFGWAKGVPINVNNFRNRREGILKVSFAGPAANLFLCFLAALMMALLGRMGMLSDGLYKFLFWMQLYNVWFAFFNLIPVPPLDGSRILSELLPAKQSWQFNEIVDRYGFYILIALVFTGITSMIINPLANGYLRLIQGLLSIVF